MSEEELWVWFLNQLNKKENGCWEWNTANHNARYGQLTICRKHIGAHVYALEHTLGRHLKENMIARHMCNNSLCCNPEHLKEGTYKENMKDRDDAGHTIKGDKHHDVKGSKHPQVKLSEQDVRTIRSLKGSSSYKELAEKYGVSVGNIGSIQRNISWTHLK